MTNKKEQAKKILYTFMDVEKDLSQPKILTHILYELINQYSTSLPMDSNTDQFYARMYGTDSVIYENDILDLIQELEEL